MISEVLYVPSGTGIDQAVQLGAVWLQEQPGDKLVLVHSKQVYNNNSLLPQLTAGAKIARPSTVWDVNWHGGPVLAPWPTEKILSTIADEIADRTTAVCLLEWREDEYLRAWVRAQGGRSLLTGDPAPGEDELLSPVVTVAMEFLAQDVNHANGLVQTYDKEITIQALQALVRSGHTFDGGVIALSGNDGQVHLLTADTLREIGHLPLRTGATWAFAAYTHDGSMLSAVDERGLIVQWDSRPRSWIDRACTIAARNLTDTEWETYLPGVPHQRTCTTR